MPKRPIQADDLLRFKHVHGPQIDPDGHRIVFGVKSIGEKFKSRSLLYWVDVDSGELHQLTFGNTNSSTPKWAPDGGAVFFVGKREDEKNAQIYRLNLNGGEAEQMTSLPEGNLAGYKISPNGEMIAFSFRLEHPDFTTEAAEKRKSTGHSTPPREIETLHYRMDGDGFFMQQREAIYVLNLATKTHRPVYDANEVNWLSFDWSPDSTRIVVSHGGLGPDYFKTPNNDVIRIVELDGNWFEIGGLPLGEKDSVAFSPNGEWIAYLGYAREEDDRGEFNRQLFVTDLDGNWKCLTAEDDVCLSTGVNSDTKSDDGSTLFWSPDGAAIYTRNPQKGAVHPCYVPVETGGIRELTTGFSLVMPGNINKAGDRIACSVGTPTRIQEIAVIDLNHLVNSPRILTHFNHEFFEEVDVVEPEETWVKAEDGHDVQAWIMKPRSIKPKSTTAAILEVHGGPHMMYGASFMHEFQLLVAQGHTVVFSNPRGSKGYGEAHTAAIRGSWGDRDWADIFAVAKMMEALPWVHPGRLGIMGGSYGGYMTNWAIGHTTMFKAAITDRCVSNLVSKAGNSDYIWRAYGSMPGCAYSNLENIKDLWKMSPIAYFDQVVTPTLVIHSEGDLRCNIEQSEQVFAALQQQGVPSKFIRYPLNTSHGMSRGGPPDLRIHRLEAILDWWRTYLA